MTEDHDAETEPVEAHGQETTGRTRMWWTAAAGVIVALVVVVVAVVVRADGDGDGDDVADPAGEGDEGPATVSGDGDDDTTPESLGDEPEAPQNTDADPVGDDGDASSEGLRADYGGDVAVGGGGDWLVPWGDGFLSFGFVYHEQPLPPLDGSLDEFFPPEVVELIRSSGVTTIGEATDVLIEADLYETVVEIVTSDPELQERIFSTPAPPPTFEVRRSADGLEWESVAGVEFPFPEFHSVVSDGTHLLVAGVVGANYEVGDPGTMQVAITTDLTSWEIHALPGPDTAGLPDVVHAESWIGDVAIGPEGWLAATSISFWLDEWELLSPHVSDLHGGWEVRADGTGLTIDIYEPYDEVDFEEPVVELEEAEATGGSDGDDVATDPAPEVAASTVIDEEFECCEVIDTIELTWDEVGIDHATWVKYREQQNATVSTWTAAWGEAPVGAVVDADFDFGSVVGTDAGYLASGWGRDTGGSRIFFSADGRDWVERSGPVSGPNSWVEQLLRVEGGVVLTAGDEFTRTTWRGESDGTNWQAVEIPGLPGDRWWGAWSASSLPGIAAIVDLTEYPEYEHYGLDDGDDGPADDVEGDYEIDGPYPEPDFWLLATRDGVNWVLEDLEDPGPEASYPQNAAINGDAVIVGLGDTWIRFALS